VLGVQRVIANPVRMAVIGTSGHGQRIAARTILDSGEVVLLGGVGGSEAGSRAFATALGLPNTYASIDALLTDPEIDAVWICSPNDLHAKHVTMAAAAGKHALVEKPLAIRPDDAQSAVAAADAAGIVLRVGFQHRFRPAHIRIRECLAAGEIGDVGYVRIHRFWPYPYYPDMPPEPPLWRQSPERSGGWIINDLGTHLIDLAQWLSGSKPVLVGAAIASQKFDIPTEDSVALVLSLGAAAIGIVEASNANQSPSSRIEAYGTKGWLRADDTLWGESAIETQRGVIERFPRIDHLVPYGAEFRDFVGALGGKRSIGATGADAAGVTAIVSHALERGHRMRREGFENAAGTRPGPVA
jgi:predicted dehydrogenase